MIFKLWKYVFHEKTVPENYFFKQEKSILRDGLNC
jgi:hypothetical protein